MFDKFFTKLILFMRYGDNIVQPGNPQITIWHMCIVCWLPKATNTHSIYVIIIAFHCNNCCTNALQCYVTCTTEVFVE